MKDSHSGSLLDLPKRTFIRRTQDYESNTLDRMCHFEQMKRMTQGIYKRGFFNSKFSDVTIEALGMKYQLHRIILVQNSFFAGMLDGSWAESDKRTINLTFDDPHITLEGVNAVFARIYGQFEVRLHPKNVFSIMAAASYFNDSDLLDICTTYIIDSITKETVVDSIGFIVASYYGINSDAIIEAIFTFLCREGFADLKEVFAQLPLSWFERIVASDCFCVPSEYERYCFIRDVIELRQKRSDRTKTGHRPLSLADSALDLSSLSLASSDSSETSGSTSASDGSEGESEETTFRDMLSYGVVYSHMRFDQLLQIRGDGFAPAHVLEKAFWTQQEFRCLIEGSAEHITTLGIQYDVDVSKDTSDPSPSEVLIPSGDTDKIDEKQVSGVLEGSIYAHSRVRFPPFRFSLEAADENRIHRGDRVYSKTQFYAGSYWIVYIQKLVAQGSSKLGIYLQRWAQDEEPEIEDPHASASHRVSVYVDRREEVQTWFQLYCFISDQCFILESKPDLFKNTQSWGWRSSKLLKVWTDSAAPGPHTIKISVVMGHV
ncbi:uncharacterized protein BJ171DRAFT_456417 [Polychytrium aggregatum]|uniref:uncharacterized protein n=1 Tax=Polychytrium aggregatum TaxID=110093 RepID=UPI0022FE90B5|nr:uncharacterized protein BJ171DRAFT_456417 [Polychytrium aggregatum]KAI9207185.1 hypothetical protein BJ171DRAFT_456417 [Polychytrium aggregatum]